MKVGPKVEFPKPTDNQCRSPPTFAQRALHHEHTTERRGWLHSVIPCKGALVSCVADFKQVCISNTCCLFGLFLFCAGFCKWERKCLVCPNTLCTSLVTSAQHCTSTHTTTASAPCLLCAPSPHAHTHPHTHAHALTCAPTHALTCALAHFVHFAQTHSLFVVCSTKFI